MTIAPAPCFGSKAETLHRLAPLLSTATVLPLRYFSVQDWRSSRDRVADAVLSEDWGRGRLIVRSSTLAEDSAAGLSPGKYLSVTDVAGGPALRSAVEEVISSYGAGVPADELGEQHVLVQPMVPAPEMAGVAFTREPNTGAHYLVVNYADDGDCEAVTSGKPARLKTFYRWGHDGGGHAPGRLGRVAALAAELEALLGAPSLDIEFAFGAQGRLYLLQVRPLLVEPAADAAVQRAAVTDVAEKVAAVTGPHPYLLGRRSVLGVMPDWNPAEIIGLRPRPLAVSLYRRLITDRQWAEQRVRYGYRDLRGFPLMLELHGLPYIDFRASCNSLIPAGVGESLARRLAEHYCDRLAANPELHDKVEFEIVFSSYTFTTEERLRNQAGDRLDEAGRREVLHALRALTNRLMRADHPARRQDVAGIASLRRRLAQVKAAPLDPVTKIYWLLEDCRRYGTLAFAGFARLGFVATEILRSLVALGVLTQDDSARLMASLNTVTNRMLRDRARLTKDEFLSVYGFLRPGTYDICSARYDEAPDVYFDWSAPPARTAEPGTFRLRPATRREIGRLLRRHGLEQTPEGLHDFITTSIIRREESKFEFTRHLSDALQLIKELGASVGLDQDDMSYIDVGCIERLYRGSENPARVLRASVREGRGRYALTRDLVLPPLILGPDDVVAFHLPDYEPNYVTQESVTAPVELAEPEPGSAGLRGKILLLPSGDPGYDWIFSQGIAGFVTRFGGANSHMAIRAHQLGIPAVIGAGETLYNQCAAARRLRIDCLNHRVEVLP